MRKYADNLTRLQNAFGLAAMLVIMTNNNMGKSLNARACYQLVRDLEFVAIDVQIPRSCIASFSFFYLHTLHSRYYIDFHSMYTSARASTF